MHDDNADLVEPTYTNAAVHRRAAWIAVGVLALIIVFSVVWPLASPHDPRQVDLPGRFGGPSVDHPVGTDELGRDVLTRLALGVRISFVAAAIAVSVATLVGVPLGLLAGYLGGWLDGIVSRVVDAIMSIPSIILAIALITAIGPGIVNAMTVIGFVFSPRVFRVVRAATLAIRHEAYVEAAIVHGVRAGTIIRTHVVPNVASSILVQISFYIGAGMIAEASLSFLGLGVRPPEASLGVMLETAVSSMERAPWLMIAPGVLLSSAVISFNVIGDSIRDARAGRR
jgi:ABC-type dipeptide/oligopeptide/nickel transport system permease subunit